MDCDRAAGERKQEKGGRIPNESSEGFRPAGVPIAGGRYDFRGVLPFVTELW